MDGVISILLMLRIYKINADRHSWLAHILTKQMQNSAHCYLNVCIAAFYAFLLANLILLRIQKQKQHLSEAFQNI